LVTFNPVMGCNDCAACASGQPQWCSRKVVLGVAPEVSAAFADWVAVPAANIVSLPEEMPAELGALVEPLPKARIQRDHFRLIWRAGHQRENEVRALAEDLRAMPLR
jgi:threonine dehydrogenase-like Zn-dependent dehydrogenase